MNYKKSLQHSVFKAIGKIADKRGERVFVIGGFVRDQILKRSTKDIDIVTLGSGIELAEKIAKELNVNCKLVQFERPGLLVDAVDNNKWDIGNIAYEKERSKTIDFSDPYVNIDANFIFRNKYSFKSNEEINSPGIKIAVVERSAYDLWLSDNFKNAELIKVKTIDGSHKIFREGSVDVLAGLKPKLLEELEINDDFKIISNIQDNEHFDEDDYIFESY